MGTLDRFPQEGAAKDEPLRRKLEADNKPLRSSAAKLTDGELLDKLRGMGFELDRSGVGNLCAGALSAEEVARPLQRDWEVRNPGGGFHVDRIWICLLALWERWWPDKVCLELNQLSATAAGITGPPQSVARRISLASRKQHG